VLYIFKIVSVLTFLKIVLLIVPNNFLIIFNYIYTISVVLDCTIIYVIAVIVNKTGMYNLQIIKDNS